MSLDLTVLILRCLLDTQVETASSQLDLSGTVSSGVISTWIVFKAIGLNEVTWGEKEKRLQGRWRRGQ